MRDRPGVWGGLVSDAYTFDAVVLGDRECDAWVHYYRHERAPFLGTRSDWSRRGSGRVRGGPSSARGWSCRPSTRSKPRGEVDWRRIHRVHQREVTDPNLVVERRTLIASFAALRAAVDEHGLSANRHAS